MGVTLTSLNEKSLREIGLIKINSLVLHQVKLAKKANLDGVVCSANEVKKIRRLFERNYYTGIIW